MPQLQPRPALLFSLVLAHRLRVEQVESDRLVVELLRLERALDIWVAQDSKNLVRKSLLT